MNAIKNTARRPLRVPLPHGKTLHLGLGKTGSVGDDALEHPPFQKLVRDGEIEVLGHQAASGSAPGGQASSHGSPSGRAHGHASAAPRRGNRGD